MQRVTAILLTALLAVSLGAPGFARGYHSYHYYYRTYHTYSHRARIHRSQEARHEFERMTGYPHGRPGYIIDHVVPLACGSADNPSNMQWQTKADAKAKDKWERKNCARHR